MSRGSAVPHDHLEPVARHNLVQKSRSVLGVKQVDLWNIALAVLSLPLWTPEADGIHSAAPTPALARPLQRTALSAGQKREEAPTPAKKPASGSGQGRAEAPLQVPLPGAPVYKDPRELGKTRGTPKGWQGYTLFGKHGSECLSAHLPGCASDEG